MSVHFILTFINALAYFDNKIQFNSKQFYSYLCYTNWVDCSVINHKCMFPKISKALKCDLFKWKPISILFARGEDTQDGPGSQWDISDQEITQD